MSIPNCDNVVGIDKNAWSGHWNIIPGTKENVNVPIILQNENKNSF